MHSLLTIDAHDATLCELWLADMAGRTNAWWRSTGPDGFDLLSPSDLGFHLCNWAHRRGLCGLPPSKYAHVVAATLAPAYVSDRAKLTDEARRYVMEFSSDRRLSFAEYGPAPTKEGAR